MNSIYHLVPILKQEESSDCVQTAAAQILSFYGIEKTLRELKTEVPVQLDSSGRPLGSSIGHMATYFIDQGFTTTIHTADIQLFDRSWIHLSSAELVENIQKRKQFIKHPVYNKEILDLVCNGFTGFLEKGGKITFPVVDEKYVYSLLEHGPVYAVVNYQFLCDASRGVYDEASKKLKKEPIQGLSNTHAIVLTGYEDGKFLFVDPDKDEEQKVDTGRFIGAYYLADIDLDSILITLRS